VALTKAPSTTWLRDFAQETSLVADKNGAAARSGASGPGRGASSYAVVTRPTSFSSATAYLTPAPILLYELAHTSFPYATIGFTPYFVCKIFAAFCASRVTQPRFVDFN
jgi:hypothetical protein